MSMFMVPFLRINRAIAASLINPNHIIESIIVSETISVLGPMFNPKFYAKIIALSIVVIYKPSFIDVIIKKHNDENLLYYQAELCTLLLFIFTICIQKF